MSEDLSQDLFRWELDRTVGLICSTNCNTVYDAQGRYAICGALEAVYVWNIRTGEVHQRWLDSGNTSEAVMIAPSPANPNTFAVGYADGSVRIWDLRDGGHTLIFHGHRGLVTALAFDASGMKLASGARDNEIIIWDLVSEAGQYRLRGHGGAVTGLAFLPDGKALVSVSKDTLVKVWDLPSQHCIETVVLHHAEITGLVHYSTASKLVTVGADNKMRIFTVKEENVAQKLAAEMDEQLNVLELIETINRSSSERSVGIALSNRERHIAVIGADKSLEIWKLRSVEEHSKQEGKKSQSWCKQIRYTRLDAKAKSVSFAPAWKVKAKQSLKLLIQLNDNRTGEMLVPSDSSQETSWSTTIESVGHRGECKAVSFSQDASMFASAALEGVKIWNSQTGSLLLTIPCQEPTALTFLNEDKNMLIGDAEGMIHFADLSSGDTIDSIQAHKGTLRALALRPDGKGMMTGGADKCIKFWEFKLSRQKMKLIKTLQMNDEVLYLRYSPDMRYVAAATMDMTIKIFFEDSLKFYLSLYGHRLPITSFDISADSKLLVSASIDKNIKIWSLEFGECRKSIFAHADAITAIAFVPGTKLFISASKDKTLKYWDCEKFMELQKLSVHQGEVWAMSINSKGDRIVSASKDRSIRVWRLGDDFLFPEEEQERDLEEKFERSMIEENPHEKEDVPDETGKASTKTMTSMKAGERIMECIEAADDERRKWDEFNAGRAQGIALGEPTMGAFFMALGKDKTPSEFVLSAFEKIPLAAVEEALLCLPTSALPSLLFYINEWFASQRNIVMSARILDMTLRLFHTSIMANGSLRLTLESIRDAERTTLCQLKDLIGFNSAAIQLSQGAEQ